MPPKSHGISTPSAGPHSRPIIVPDRDIMEGARDPQNKGAALQASVVYNACMCLSGCLLVVPIFFLA